MRFFDFWKGEFVLFSIVWDISKKRYIVKQTCILSVEEIFYIYCSYRTQKDALKALKSISRKPTNRSLCTMTVNG